MDLNKQQIKLHSKIIIIYYGNTPLTANKHAKPKKWNQMHACIDGAGGVPALRIRRRNTYTPKKATIIIMHHTLL
jgi:hypothetical protein